MLTVIDFGAGNLKSVANALTKCGVQYELTDDPDEVREGKAFLLPGVGAAKPAMDRLRQSGMADAIRDVVARGAPFLGICLGMQLLLEHSEEQDSDCLGVVRGHVHRFDDSDLLVPHVGWNRVHVTQQHRLFDGINADAYVYFVHSYYVALDDEADLLATCDYGQRFAAALVKGNVMGVQFHPEKSGDVGLKLLDNFAKFAIEYTLPSAS